MLDNYMSSWRILFWIDAAINIGFPIPVLLYPSVLLRRWYLPGKAPELMSDAAKQLVLLLWVCAGLIFVVGLMALAAAVSPVGNSGAHAFRFFSRPPEECTRLAMRRSAPATRIATYRMYIPHVNSRALTSDARTLTFT